MEYLLNNPVKHPEQRQYLIDKEKGVRNTIIRALQEKAATKKKSSGFRWTPENTVRLMHALVDDDIKAAWLKRY